MALLDGKAALVTGAGRGIGRGIALALAAAGARVVVNDLGTSLGEEGVAPGPADEVVAEIRAMGGAAVADYGSVADFEQAVRMVRLFPETLGRDLDPPPGTGLGALLDARPATEWTDLGGGRRRWRRP